MEAITEVGANPPQRYKLYGINVKIKFGWYKALCEKPFNDNTLFHIAEQTGIHPICSKNAKKTNKDLCYATAWALVSSMDYETTSPNKYYDDILLFLKDYCSRNNEKISDWLLNQMKDFQ